MLDLLKALRELEQVETKMAELYEWYAELFADDAEACALFSHLQMEEISHQNILRYESRIVRANPRAFRELVFDTEMLDRTLEAIDGYRQANERPTLEQAVQTALEFEGGAAELYYITTFRDSARDFAQFVTSLHAASRTHFDRLHRFASRREIALPPGTAPPEIAVPAIQPPAVAKAPSQAKGGAAVRHRRA